MRRWVNKCLERYFWSIINFEFILHTAAIFPPALSPQTAIFSLFIGKFSEFLTIQLIELMASFIAVGIYAQDPFYNQ